MSNEARITRDPADNLTPARAEDLRACIAYAPTSDGPLAKTQSAELMASIVTERLIARLERDLSGVSNVEIHGERATVVTSRGTRYPFRLRDNGVWGLTIFTAELGAEAERAARDLDVVKGAAEDYDRVGN